MELDGSNLFLKIQKPNLSFFMIILCQIIDRIKKNSDMILSPQRSRLKVNSKALLKAEYLVNRFLGSFPVTKNFEIK